MAVQCGSRRGLGGEDAFDAPIRVRRRTALQELGDYPFFLPEEEAPVPSWVMRHGVACLTALAIVGTIETVVLGMLLR